MECSKEVIVFWKVLDKNDGCISNTWGPCYLKFKIWVPSSPTAAVNDLALKTARIHFLKFWRSKVWNWAKVKVLPGWHPSWRLWGRVPGLAFSSFWSFMLCLPWLIAPSSTFKANSLVSLNLSASVTFTFLLQSILPITPLIQTLVITFRAHPDNPG